MHIVIVGGGAGGLELAAMLSDKYGKKFEITLVDSSLKHVWKPLLHEVGTGTLATHENELDYIPYASEKGFQFVYGKLENVNREKKVIYVSAVQDEAGNDLIPQREISYDALVLSIGSLSNDFNIPGVKENCLFLDNLNQAEAMQKILVNNIIQQVQTTSEPLNIAIVGAGATGVELAAEMYYAIHQGSLYGEKENSTQITLIEAQSRIVPQLPERTSEALTNYLEKLGIKIITNEQVSEVTPNSVKTKSGKTIPARIKVWAAGIKADEKLSHLDGLEVNRLNQLVVNENLQTTRDPSIFAIGDCASCYSTETKKFVTPTAQAAHQEAVYLTKYFPKFFKNEPWPKFAYHDYGALVTLGRYKIVGNLMGRFTTSIHIEGLLARFLYFSIQKKHQIALHGYWRVFWTTLTNLFSSSNRSRLKLH